MPLRQLVAVLLLLYSGSAMAQQSLDINLSDNAARLTYYSPLGSTTYGRSELFGGILFNDDDNVVGVVGFLVSDEAGAGSPGLSAGAGVMAYGVSTDDDDGLAVTLGGHLGYSPPGMSRLVFGVHGAFAPGIVSFMDAESLWEAGGRVGYELLPDVVVYLGYRKIRMGVEQDKDITVDEGSQLGINFRF